ncbi:hypothetical protein WR25_01375 [Diploscapter pachys]|uniref:Aminotransferase class I/classII large domain-containing protein n=1 Tax=Diploscapter pachys TaxID=2018661 RepID=A0A2A2LVG5_9BILA|nr:hypothetical protein WR25_01375 [Diploscapter pachys]
MYQMIAVKKSIYGDDVLFAQNLIKEESVFCLPGSAFSAPGYIRLVLTYDEEIMREAADRIKEFCERYAAARCQQEDSSDEGCEVNSCESS